MDLPPDVCAAVLSKAFVVEAVDGCDLPRLVVPADERDAIWVPNLEAEKEEERFQAIESSVDEVACISLALVYILQAWVVPMNRYAVSGTSPPTRKSSIRSWNWP